MRLYSFGEFCFAGPRHAWTNTRIPQYHFQLLRHKGIIQQFVNTHNWGSHSIKSICFHTQTHTYAGSKRIGQWFGAILGTAIAQPATGYVRQLTGWMAFGKHFTDNHDDGTAVKQKYHQYGHALFIRAWRSYFSSTKTRRHWKASGMTLRTCKRRTSSWASNLMRPRNKSRNSKNPCSRLAYVLVQPSMLPVYICIVFVTQWLSLRWLIWFW